MKFIYGLHRRPAGQIRYVGCTGMDLETRLRGHLSEVFGSQSRRAQWFRGTRCEVDWCLLEECPSHEAVWREWYWICALRERGNDLVNSTRSIEGMYEMAAREIDVGLSERDRTMVSLMEAGKIKEFSELGL